MRGAWQLKDLKGPVDLYTNECADIYVDTETGAEYVRGERKLFECGTEQLPYPELVEHTGKFKLFVRDQSASWTAADSLREIMVQGMFE